MTVASAAGSPLDSERAGWRPTGAHVRSTVLAVALAILAVLVRRPDLLVLAAPLAVVSVWSALTRPSRVPTLEHRLADATIREGEATVWQGSLSAVEGADLVAAVMPRTRWIVSRPASGVLTSSIKGDHAELALPVRSTRWGHHRIERVTVVATSAWGAFGWNTKTTQSPLTSLPLPSIFDSSTSIRRTNGLVGLDRSSRPGEGTDFAGIRPFQSGDRMRRINWRRSLRVGQLHVTSTWADQDTLVVLEVDATGDVGISGGVDGVASSLDRAVRAAGAIAEHHLQRGDRVTLRLFGSSPRAVPAATGHVHLRRILEALAAIRAGSDPSGFVARGREIVSADSLLIMLTPLFSPAPLERAVALTRRGVTVVVIDTLPESVVEDPEPATALAWRIRLLERQREVRRAEEAGVAVVVWRGPGSLDEFLRNVARRASAPRMVSR